PKAILAVACPIELPSRFANTGGVQTRGACPESFQRDQTVPAFVPVTIAQLGQATRPTKTAKTMNPCSWWKTNSKCLS
ncbi:MAG TPA: hypothetical protein PKJ63_15930, partial [Cyclobacteriaceae bacterium]|nr:hypothetical protein [Cyclobacteriaceae bacterium]